MAVSLCDIVELYLTAAGRLIWVQRVCGSKALKADGMYCIIGYKWLLYCTIKYDTI